MKLNDVRLCVEALRALRVQRHQELGTSIVEELDAVIQRLEHCCEHDVSDVDVSAELRGRVLEVISHATVIATNLVELIRMFRGPH